MRTPSRPRFSSFADQAVRSEADTPSARLPGHLPEDVKAARRDAIMAAQQPIAQAFNAGLVGRTLDVQIDRKEPGGEGIWAGRTYADAPDVDGLVYVGADDLRPGDLLRCEIVEALDYDLVARPARPRNLRRRRRPRANAKAGTSLPILG